MNCLIACSQDWFDLDIVALSANNEFKFISQPSELNDALLNDLQPDYIFFPHWNWIVDKAVYENYECVVFHTAPLPYGRGGSPIQNLIAEGFERAPVCAIKMTSVLDGGPIYGKREISLNSSLSSIFANINEAINALISMILSDRPIPKEQVGDPHYFKRRTKLDNAIPNDVSLKEVYDRIRMLDADEYPNAYLEIGDYVVEFEKAELDKNAITAKAKIRPRK